MSDVLPIRAAIGLPPDETVRAFRARDALRTTVRWSEMWHEDHARAFTVAKVAQVDLLATIRASLDKVLSEGGTLERWKADLVPQLQRAGWWGRVEDEAVTGTSRPVLIGARRLRTIYDTNLRMSRAAGRWGRIQALKATRPFLMYVAVGDRRTRPLHRRWGGLDPTLPIRIILPVDHPCWSIYYPPNDWGCRCTVRQLSQRDLDRNGWRVTTDPELRRVGWITTEGKPGGNPRNFHRAGRREPVAVPGGIGPGFDYNPGIARGPAGAPPPGIGAGFGSDPASASVALLAEKAAASIAALARTDRDAAEQALRAILNPETAQELARHPWSAFPAMVLTDDVRTAAGFDDLIALFTVEAFARLRAQGIDPTDLIRRLPDLSRQAEIVAGVPGNLILAARNGEEWTVASLRGPPPQVTSVRSMSTRALNKRLGRRPVVRDREVRPLDELLPDLLAAPADRPRVHAIGRAGVESAPDIAGFSRTIDSQEVRHAFKRHGNDPHPVTEETVRLIPTIIAEGRRIDQIAQGHREQVFVLEREGLFHVYVERVGAKQARVTLRSLFVEKILRPRLLAALLAVIAQEAAGEMRQEEAPEEPVDDDGEGEVQ